MRKFWWPEALYEAKPYGALTLGLMAGVVAMARSLGVGNWDAAFAIVLVAGSGVIVYGGVILQMRHDYRRRSRWSREARP